MVPVYSTQQSISTPQCSKREFYLLRFRPPPRRAKHRILIPVSDVHDARVYQRQTAVLLTHTPLSFPARSLGDLAIFHHQKSRDKMQVLPIRTTGGTRGQERDHSLIPRNGKKSTKKNKTNADAPTCHRARSNMAARSSHARPGRHHIRPSYRSIPPGNGSRESRALNPRRAQINASHKLCLRTSWAGVCTASHGTHEGGRGREGNKK